MSLRSRIARRSADPSHPPSVAMLVRLYARRYRSAVVRARKDPDAAALYAVRNAIRRANALLALATILRPRRAYARLLRALERPFRACGAVRDLELVRRRLRDEADPPAGTESMLREVRGRERAKRYAAIHALWHTHPRRAARILRAAMERLVRALRTPDRLLHARTLVTARLDAAARATAAAKARAADGSPKQVHRARLTLKDQRYLVELAAALGVLQPQELVATLAGEQDALGDITDNAVLLRELDRYRARRPRAAPALGALRRATARDGLALRAAYRGRVAPSVTS